MNQRSLIPIVSLLIFFSLVIVTACTPSTESEAVLEVVTVMATRSVTQTAVPTHIPTATETVTPLATQTSTPTAVPTHIPTATKTPTPLPTQTSTPNPVSTLTPPPIPTPKILNKHESPSGEWIATLEEGYFFNEPDSYLFRVVSTSEETEWVVEHIVPGEGGPMTVSYPNPVAWSADGQFMYFTHSGFGDGCGPFVMGKDLYQLDLETGQVTEMISNGYWFALSPDGQRIAYLSHDRGVVIQDLLTGEEIESQLDLSSVYEHIDFSDLTWSPDGNTLLVLGAIDLCVVPPCPDCNDYVIVKINVNNLEQTTVVEENTSLRSILNWTEPDKVWLDVADGNAWLNPETGEITLADE